MTPSTPFMPASERWISSLRTEGRSSSIAMAPISDHSVDFLEAAYPSTCSPTLIGSYNVADRTRKPVGERALRSQNFEAPMRSHMMEKILLRRPARLRILSCTHRYRETIPYSRLGSRDSRRDASKVESKAAARACASRVLGEPLRSLNRVKNVLPRLKACAVESMLPCLDRMHCFERTEKKAFQICRRASAAHPSSSLGVAP
jgi:hypothetical protein